MPFGRLVLIGNREAGCLRSYDPVVADLHSEAIQVQALLSS